MHCHGLQEYSYVTTCLVDVSILLPNRYVRYVFLSDNSRDQTLPLSVKGVAYQLLANAFSSVNFTNQTSIVAVDFQTGL